jgi:hypothetical protein
MAVSAVPDPLAGGRPTAQRDAQPSSPLRLWPALFAKWTERLDRRIEADLRWLDHTGVLEDCRRSSGG